MADISANEIIQLIAQDSALTVTAERTVHGPRVVIDATPMHRRLPAILLPVEALTLAADLRGQLRDVALLHRPGRLGEIDAQVGAFTHQLTGLAVDEFVAQAQASRTPPRLEVIAGGKSIGVFNDPDLDHPGLPDAPFRYDPTAETFVPAKAN